MLLKKEYITRIGDSEKNEYLKTPLIKLITGPRRAGKSVMALQILSNQNFAYLNFDDDQLLKYFDEDLVIQALHDVYFGFNYLLLDEIQNLPQWELWVNKMHRRGFNLIITGSNSKLLSHELGTALTGRYVPITVLPFGFHEILLAANQTIHNTESLTPQKTGSIQGILNNYLINGGFPETVLNPDILKNYLSTLFDSILLKDILKRFRVRQTQQLYDLANYLLANYTNPLSFNQLKDTLDFNSVATAQKFSGYLEETFIFQRITRYHHKLKQQQKSLHKNYIIDNGFIKARAFELSPNYGRLLENLVFVELLRRGYRPGLDIFYYRTRNNREIDFLIRKGHKIEQLIQVCFDVEQPQVNKRETSALVEAAKELNCNNLLIVSWNKEEINEKEQYVIKLVPAHKWLLHKT